MLKLTTLFHIYRYNYESYLLYVKYFLYVCMYVCMYTLYQTITKLTYNYYIYAAAQSTKTLQ